MLNSSGIRIAFALVASIGIHCMLIGLDNGINQSRPVRNPFKKVTFRLVARQAEPPKQEITIVKTVEADVVRKIKPRHPDPAPLEIPPQTSTAEPVSESEKVAAKNTPPVAQQEDMLSPETEVHREDGLATLPQAAAESHVPGILEVVMAKPLYRVNPPPSYPAKARRRNLQGTVILEVTVSAQGKVDQLQVNESSGYRILDQAALKAVRKWVFEPGSRNGLRVAMTVLVPVRFTLQ